MIVTNKIRGLIAENGYTQRAIAKMLGMTEKTFYAKMKKGVFDSDEIYELIQILSIENPATIFFVDEVTC